MSRAEKQRKERKNAFVYVYVWTDVGRISKPTIRDQSETLLLLLLLTSSSQINDSMVKER